MTGDDGPHTQGAIDVAIIGGAAFTLVSLALRLGWSGIGISQRAGKPRFVHLDRLTNKRPAIWSY